MKKGNERQNRNKSQTKRVNKRLKPVLNLEFSVKFYNSFSFVLQKTSAFFFCYDKRKVIEIKKEKNFNLYLKASEAAVANVEWNVFWKCNCGESLVSTKCAEKQYVDLCARDCKKCVRRGFPLLFASVECGRPHLRKIEEKIHWKRESFFFPFQQIEGANDVQWTFHLFFYLGLSHTVFIFVFVLSSRNSCVIKVVPMH